MNLHASATGWVWLTLLAFYQTTQGVQASDILPLTAYEAKVKPYLLRDVRHYDEWPGTGWELLGMTESQIKSRYLSTALLTKADYSRTKNGARLVVNWGAAITTYALKYDSGKVSSVVREDALLIQNQVVHYNPLADRDQALGEALEKANKRIANELVSKDHNPGFLWEAYRERARILLALGRKSAAANDITAAEKVERDILNNPARAKKDKRPII